MKYNISKDNIVQETYLVKFNYQKQTGFWVWGNLEEVYIEAIHGINEKDNHNKAAEIILEKYTNAKIVAVYYC